MSEFALYGYDLFGEVVKPKASGPVAERFTLPPFTILDARTGEWQERKRAWIKIGISSEMGRDTGVDFGPGVGGEKSIQKGVQGHIAKGTSPEVRAVFESAGTGASIFDPVIAELAYRWFSPENGQVVDPFAGGSVRGIVACALGRKYWGCDLRQEQIAANEQQADEIQPAVRPVWVCGDSMDTLADAPEADFVFSCPPYGDLEKYSDDPRDLSAMDWHAFVAAYKRIILRAVGKMKADTFACFVVGDFRDSRGFYRNFVSETIDGFEQVGARLYNEAILATPVGSAAMRVTKQFESGRKLAKTHQNVLVFCKGDPRTAARKCGA
jgi:16S rRNA G966 N2-methylase RsmD